MLKPAGTFADLKHLQGRQEHQPRARLPAAPRRLRQGLRRGRAQVRARVPTQKVLHLSFEPFACIADYKDTHVTFYDSLAGSVVRAHRDRPPARLAGEQGAHQGAVSRLGLRLQALHQARGAGARAVHDRAQAREGRATPSRRCSTRSPGIPRRSASRAASTRTARSSRANARCSGTAAPMPTSARASRRSPASPRPAPTTSTTSRIDSYALYTNVRRRPARCAASACRSSSGPTKATWT